MEWYSKKGLSGSLMTKCQNLHIGSNSALNFFGHWCQKHGQRPPVGGKGTQGGVDSRGFLRMNGRTITQQCTVSVSLPPAAES